MSPAPFELENGTRKRKNISKRRNPAEASEPPGRHRGASHNKAACTNVRNMCWVLSRSVRLASRCLSHDRGEASRKPLCHPELVAAPPSPTNGFTHFCTKIIHSANISTRAAFCKAQITPSRGGGGVTVLCFHAAFILRIWRIINNHERLIAKFTNIHKVIRSK